MAIFRTEDYAIDPGDFEVEEQDDCVALIPPDGDGAMQITAFVADGSEVTDDEIAEASADGAPEDAEREPVRCGDFRGFHSRFTREDGAWRVWWLAAGGCHLYVTYNGAEEDAGRHDAAIDAVMATLRQRSN
jgi:hypothetical protein